MAMPMLAEGSSSLPAICSGAPSASSTRCATLTAVPGTGDVLEQDRELVAGQPRDQVRFAHAGLQALRDFLEQVVAGQVAEAVVDHLEAVDVQVQQRALALRVALEQREHALEPLAQVAAVRQAGQRVVHDLVLELLLDALAFVDLAGAARWVRSCTRCSSCANACCWICAARRRLRLLAICEATKLSSSWSAAL